MSFCLYWFSNLYLWYPWSYDPRLGITLMLTLSPLIWIIGIIYILQRKSNLPLLKSAILISIVFVVISVLSDLFFFGIIRDSLHELLKPTTYYGYLYILILPIIVSFIGKSKLQQNKSATNKSIFFPFVFGCLFISILFILIK